LAPAFLLVFDERGAFGAAGWEWRWHKAALTSEVDSPKGLSTA
jgi:hypothetical protein